MFILLLCALHIPCNCNVLLDPGNTEKGSLGHKIRTGCGTHLVDHCTAALMIESIKQEVSLTALLK